MILTMWMTWQIFLHRHLNPLTIIRIRINLWVNSNSIKDRRGLPIKNTLLFWLPIPDFLTSCSHEHWHICSQIMMLDTLDSLPRLRFSDAQMEVLMFAMRELGVRDVPSLRTFRRAQKKLRTEISHPSNRCESVRGNIFYINDIATQVARVKTFYHFIIFYFLTRRHIGLRKPIDPALPPSVSWENQWIRERSLQCRQVGEREYTKSSYSHGRWPK